MIDRRPGLIARCAGADDVIASIRFAREHDVPLSVRGGHNVTGTAVRDGGLVVAAIGFAINLLLGLSAAELAVSPSRGSTL